LKIGAVTRDFQLPNYKITQLPNLLHFFMRRMLAAPSAEFLQLQSVRRRLPVLRRRIIPLFAITALHCNDLSGHNHSSWLLTFSSYLFKQKIQNYCHPEAASAAEGPAQLPCGAGASPAFRLLGLSPSRSSFCLAYPPLTCRAIYIPPPRGCVSSSSRLFGSA
jgi:hypothetical protein